MTNQPPIYLSPEDREFWKACFLKAIDLYREGNTPVYDENCEPIQGIFEYCKAFADACVESLPR